MAKRITVTIDAEGNPTVEASGFKGKGCQIETAALLKDLGGGWTVMQKPEFYQAAAEPQKVSR